jgi:hypothetical protein
MYNLTNIYLDPSRTHALTQYSDNNDRSYYYHFPIANVHELTLNQSYKVLETYSGKVRYLNFKVIDPCDFIDMDVTSQPKWVELIKLNRENPVSKSIKASEIMGVSIPSNEEFGIVFFRDGTESKMTFEEIHALVMDNYLNFIISKREDEEWLSIF